MAAHATVPPWDHFCFFRMRLRSGFKKRGGCCRRWCVFLLLFFFSRPVIFGSSVKSVRGQPVRQDSAGAFGICSYQQERSALQRLQGGGGEGLVLRQGSMKGRAGKRRTDKSRILQLGFTYRVPSPSNSPLEVGVVTGVPEFRRHTGGPRDEDGRLLFVRRRTHNKYLSGRKWLAVVMILKRKLSLHV